MLATAARARKQACRGRFQQVSLSVSPCRRCRNAHAGTSLGRCSHGRTAPRSQTKTAPALHTTPRRRREHHALAKDARRAREQWRPHLEGLPAASVAVARPPLFPTPGPAGGYGVRPAGAATPGCKGSKVLRLVPPFFPLRPLRASRRAARACHALCFPLARKRPGLRRVARARGPGGVEPRPRMSGAAQYALDPDPPLFDRRLSRVSGFLRRDGDGPAASASAWARHAQPSTPARASPSRSTSPLRGRRGGA